MKLGGFLWRYFRRYTGVAALTLIASLVFSSSNVVALALFKSIQQELLRIDPSPAPPPEAAGEGGDGASSAGQEPSAGKELPLPQLVDLEKLLETAYDSMKAALGINEDNVVVFLPLLFAAVFLLRSASDFGSGYLSQVMGLGASNDLRNDLYERILHQSSRFYAEHPSGELLSRVANDVSVMQNAVSNRLLDLLQQSLTLLGLLWYLLSIEWKLALVCFVAVPAIAYPVVRFGQGIRRTSRGTQERLADLSNLVSEAVRGHRVVKAFGMEGFELGRFRDAARRHLKVRLKSQLLANGVGPVVGAVIAVAAASFLIYAGHAIRAEELSASKLLTFLAGLAMLYDPIRRLNKVNIVLQEALAAAQRIHEVMAIPNDVVERPHARPLAGFTDSIRFAGVSFAYEREAVLRGVDLEVRRGEVVALVGSSGAGKSTLVNLLPRFYDPDAGAVLIDGVDLRDATLASVRGLIGLVTQDTVLFNDTVRNNIAYGRLDAPLERVRTAAGAAYADDFISALPAGYDTMIGESGFKLSGGERQRLAIARALLKDPPILILDEATSHLDSQSEALVQKALYNLMQGRTALVIAHRLSTVQRADRIVVLERGRIVEQGSHRQLLAAGGQYRRLHDLQFRDA